jgi:prepilin-type N-terminal cleavage/methylation domain-containing protein
MRRSGGFTLIELLIVVAIFAILAAIAIPNYLEAQERAQRASDATNLKTIGTALETYVLDYGKLPPADQEAGPFQSHTDAYAGAIKNGPAAGGSWDAVPWLLVERKYVPNWEILFCPRYLKLYKGGKTQRGNYPRYHNFRYAYNTNALGSKLSTGRGTDSSTDNKARIWLLRDLYLAANRGWFASSYPRYPADFKYPWGDKRDVEYVLYNDLRVKLVKGGTDKDPDDIRN